MKIVFMGTPDFAVPSLEALLARGHEVAAVFTQPDKPKGRGHKLLPPPVKSLALERGIPVYQPATLRTEEAAETLRALQPELIVVAAYGKLLPPAVLPIPPRGCINVHGSLLPQYRGAAPIQWAVLNGEKKTGVTIQQMGEGLDTGDMLQKAETEIGENETSGELFDRLKEIGAALLVDTIDCDVRADDPQGDGRGRLDAARAGGAQSRARPEPLAGGVLYARRQAHEALPDGNRPCIGGTRHDGGARRRDDRALVHQLSR